MNEIMIAVRDYAKSQENQYISRRPTCTELEGRDGKQEISDRSFLNPIDTCETATRWS